MFRLSHRPRPLVWKHYLVRPQFRGEMADLHHDIILARVVKETATYFYQAGKGRGLVHRSKPDYVRFDREVIIRGGTWNAFVFTVSDNPFPYQIKTLVVTPPPEDVIRRTLEVHDGLYVDGQRRGGQDMVEQVIEKGIGLPLDAPLLARVEDSLHKHWMKETGGRLF